MALAIAEEPELAFEQYEAIPISFRVDRVMRVTGLHLEEEAIAEPYVKEYDAPGSRPTDWPWDLTNWGRLAAREDRALVGGVVVAWATPGLDMLEGRADLTVLWDLRVLPSHRRRGVGRALFRAAADWSRTRGASCMKIETQQINVPACRFYAAQGCRLAAVDPDAYPELPQEIQLMWRLDL